MKKKILITLILVFSILTISSITINAKASFKESSKEVIDLGYGVSIDKVTGTSKSTFWESYWGGSTNAEGRGQTIYTANISKDSPAFIVQWGIFNGVENNWGVTSLSQIAKDYENTHPGKKVLVATNNWLSDCSSDNVGELDGVQIIGGLNYRVSDKQGNNAFAHEYIARPFILGFDKDGHIIYDDEYNSEDYTNELVLSIYNGVDKEKTYLDMNVSKINELPSNGEIAIYFSNIGNEEVSANGAKIYEMNGTVRHDFANTSEFLERDAFAKGKLVKECDSINFNGKEEGTYFLVSKNDKFNNLDITNLDLVCQYELLGELKDIIGATTYYYHIVRDGVAYNNNYNNDKGDAVEWSKGHQINNEIHPRTALLLKEDGTLALSVIDGRRADQGMTGMDYEDMANFYKSYYSAKEVFNYDGGGSSCMVITNSSGGFDIINDPSDGHQRSVANACLIVVEEEPFKVSCSEDEVDKLILNITNIKEDVQTVYALFNDELYEIKEGVEGYEIIINDLEKESKYTFQMCWKNKDDDVLYKGGYFTFETAYQFATLDYYKIDYDEDGTLVITIKVIDTERAFNKGTITIGDETQTFRDLESEIMFLNIDSNKEYDGVIRLSSKFNNKTYTKTTNFKVNEGVKPIIIDDNKIDDKKGGCANASSSIVFIMISMFAVAYVKRKRYF